MLLTIVIQLNIIDIRYFKEKIMKNLQYFTKDSVIHFLL